jgi:glycosyltransferase involved in cell wall biosynthesis
MEQLVSILIPAYNASKWIPQCIESAIGQTWRKKEIIVVDDGSQDATLKIAKKYERHGVLVKSQANNGASAARNKALSLAHGSYIQWLDADDILAPDKIEKQMVLAEGGKDSRILLSSAWGEFYTKVDKAIFSPNLLWQDLNPSEWLYRKINHNLWMAIQAWLVSRKLTELAGPWNEKLFRDNDGEYFCRILMYARRIQFVKESVSFVRGSTGGISSDGN